MEEFGQEQSMPVAAAPAPSLNSGPSQGPVPGWKGRTWLVAIPLAFLVIYAFIPILDNGFVVWDDDENFLDNRNFRGLGAAQVKWAWTTFWVGAYQPLAWLLFETQYVFCQLDPRGYHLTSLLLQVAIAVVLYVLTVALLVRCRRHSYLESPWTCLLSAGLATALFAAHPLRVEAVAWVSCQPYLPAILFSLLSVLAYLRAFPMDSPPRRVWLAGSFLLFVAAMLFKAPAVTLPAVLLILDVYPLRRLPGEIGRWFGTPERRVLLEKVPFVIASLLFMGLAIVAKPQTELPIAHHGAWLGLVRACYATWFYIYKTVFPVDLINYYDYPKALNWLERPFFLSILATLAMTAGSFRLRRRWPGLLAAWLCYLVILAPNSGIVWISDQIAADRYSYMAMLSFVMLAAAGLYWACRMSSRWHPVATVGIVMIGFGAIVGLTALTRNQCRTWRDSETMWNHALYHGANSKFKLHCNLGVALAAKGNVQEAEAHYNEALRLYSGCYRAHSNLGQLYNGQGKFEQAVAHSAAALRLNPNFSAAHYNLGAGLYSLGKYAAARDHFAEAIRLKSDFRIAYNASAMLMAACPEAKLRNGRKAVEFAMRICEMTDWADPNCLNTLAAAQAEAGHFDEAIKSQEKAIELLTDVRQKDDYRSRLMLYRARRPYRKAAPQHATTMARP